MLGVAAAQPRLIHSSGKRFGSVVDECPQMSAPSSVLGCVLGLAIGLLLLFPSPRLRRFNAMGMGAWTGRQARARSRLQLLVVALLAALVPVLVPVLVLIVQLIVWPGAAQAIAAQAIAAPRGMTCHGLVSQLFIGAGMLILTSAIHSVVTVLQAELMQLPQLVAWCATGGRRLLMLLGMVLLIAVALLVDILLWALLYRHLGLFAGLEPSLYFSGITFTTVGYGDLTLPYCWRLLSVAEAVNGVLMAGWSTAQLVYAVQRAIALRMKVKGKLP